MDNRPNFVTDEHLEYLDDLRESGDTNMFGGKSFLLNKFPKLSNDQARDVLTYWMETFGDENR